MSRLGFLAGLVALLAVAAPTTSPPLTAPVSATAPGGAPSGAAARLIGVLLGPSPLEADLRRLTDEIGGRMSGSEANRRAVAWGLDAFRQAGLDDVHAEAFELPVAWGEGDTGLDLIDPFALRLRAVSIAWSPPTPEGGIEAPVLDLGFGAEADFARAGRRAKGALLLVNRAVLRTWADLFAEYANAPPVIARARAAGAAGILWISTKEHHVLYRHMNTSGTLDALPQVIVSREDALRVGRLLAAGRPVRARLSLPNRVGGAFPSENVVAEIRGGDRADEIVALGAHLDSWDLGTGALDNGCNVALVVEVARALRAAGIAPRRTLRFILWNGEEQGMRGSLAYVRAHRGELDRFVAYVNVDGGNGRITGYSLGGRTDVEPAVREALRPVESWGMNDHTLDASGGSDHLDFLLEGVPTLDANQLEADYLPNYHASSDTLDKVDVRALKLHAAYVAVTLLGLSDRDERAGARLGRAEVEALIERTGFDRYLKDEGYWEPWQRGERGRALDGKSAP